MDGGVKAKGERLEAIEEADNMTEWRILPLKGKKASYYASNTGQILSCMTSNSTLRFKALSPRNNEPYCPCCIRNHLKGFHYSRMGNSGPFHHDYVHRLVASVFCPCPSIFHTEVDHIDNNKFNNNAANLRWVTREENIHARVALKRGEIVISPLQKTMFYVE